MRRFTVPAGSPRLLVVAFNRFGQRKVNDETDIRLVDAHSKSDRGANDLHKIQNEASNRKARAGDYLRSSINPFHLY